MPADGFEAVLPGSAVAGFFLLPYPQRPTFDKQVVCGNILCPSGSWAGYAISLRQRVENGTRRQFLGC